MSKWFMAAVLAPLLLMIVLIPALGGKEEEAAGCAPAGSTLQANAPGSGVGQWSAQQAANAAQLISVGAELNMPARAQTLIVAAAMDESNLIPQGQQGGITNAGGRAYGILQQTPYESGGDWGTIAQVMDIDYAARQFYRHLVDVPGWETMAPTAAIHAVQRNADPTVYAKFWDPALELVNAISTRGASNKVDGATGGGQKAAASLPGVVGDVDAAAGCGAGGGFTSAVVTGTGRDYVGPFNQAQLIARVKELAASGQAWLSRCQNFAAQAMGRPNSGYPTANDAWATFVAQGTAHPANAADGRQIPVGAWVYFDTSNWAGHVGVYMGLQNGVPMMASTDAAPDGSYRANALNIVPFKAIEGWGPYLGWAAPWGERVETAPASTSGTSAESAGVGSVGMATANIPNRSGNAGLRTSMSKVASTRPDFITLNEQQQRSLKELVAATPGYAAYRDPSTPTGTGASQAKDTVVMWKASDWQAVDGGRVQIVEDDRNTYRGRVVVWDRYITWITLERQGGGAKVNVISVHHMTDPSKFGPNKPRRQQAYGNGMDTLRAVADRLESTGPVLIGGDFNVSAQQTGSWAAPAKMRAAGYGQVHTGVDYLFAPTNVKFTKSWNGPMVSDHRWLAAQIGAR
ncbi:MAG: hypothetical protein ACRDPS_16555 [Nocardioides sp.]|uniref:hypothetical protein n=1 Tax=Nocardioides sp. TaxID=35761 RepID=UPI003D6BD443